ncbi:hypothetical protein E143388_07867 [Rhodococcus opacus]|nr:hypothetical protein E143388_07867 [Rhodococcus opacus]
MTFSRGATCGMALCAAVGLVLTGCGNDSSEDLAATTSQGVAATSTASDASTSTTTGAAAGTATDSEASGPRVGTAQKVSGDGWNATITVGENPTKHESFTFNGLLVPVSIDVESGSVPAAPSYWKVHTLSGRTIPGTSIGSVPTVIGDRPFDRAVEGLIPFSSYNSKDLADDVSITEVALYATSTANDPIARWEFPAPLAVRDIPPAAE